MNFTPEVAFMLRDDSRFTACRPAILMGCVRLGPKTKEAI
jgi:hypothetical protein